jgi:hypothetical protein
LTTALYVTREQPEAPPAAREKRLREIKEHVTVPEAREAIAAVDRWISEVTGR